MAALSYLKQEDITFLTNLIADITNELCECDCCKKEQGCSIFERVYVAANVLYKKVYDLDDTTHIDNLNILEDESCIDWDTISSRINSNSSQKHKFVNKSRKKLLSRFYKYLYETIDAQTGNKFNGATDCEDLDLSIFGSNATNVIENCLDECCN